MWALSIQEQQKQSRSLIGEPISGHALTEGCCPENCEQGKQSCSGDNRVQTVVT